MLHSVRGTVVAMKAKKQEALKSHFEVTYAIREAVMFVKGESEPK